MPNLRTGWRRPALLLVLVLTMAGAASGCGSDSSDNGSSDSSNSQATGETGNQGAQNQNGSSNGKQSGPPPGKGKPDEDLRGTGRDVRQAIKALNTVNDRFKDGTPYDLEETTRGGSPAWEIKVAFKTGKPLEFIVTRSGNRIINQSKHKHDDDVDKANQATVKLTSALALSGRKVNGNLDEAEIDREGGRIVWTATFKDGSTEHETFVDAKSGKLVRVKSEND